MYHDIELKLREILKRIYGVDTPIDKIGMQDNLASLGINSLGILKLMTEVESEFEIEFDDEDFDYNNFQTLENLALYLEERLGTQEGAKNEQ